VAVSVPESYDRADAGEPPPGELDVVRILGTLAVEQAVRSLA
jgi:hypothetical protein